MDNSIYSPGCLETHLLGDTRGDSRLARIGRLAVCRLAACCGRAWHRRPSQQPSTNLKILIYGSRLGYLLLATFKMMFHVRNLFGRALTFGLVGSRLNKKLKQKSQLPSCNILRNKKSVFNRRECGGEFAFFPPLERCVLGIWSLPVIKVPSRPLSHRGATGRLTHCCRA